MSDRPHDERQLTIELTWAIRREWRARSLLLRVARFVAAREGFWRGTLSIAVVGNRRMARLHELFMNDPSPTDVLTFDLGCDTAAGVLDGEIVVCADVALRAVRRSEQPTSRSPTAGARRELALYVTHGILHLAGYDDHDPRAFERMHAREDELLSELKLGPVFASQ